MSRGTWRAPSDPTARLLRCYGDLFPRRPHCACFEHVRNLAATSATLETLLRSAALPRRSMRFHNDPAAISGDLADFADRGEVAVLCDWGIMSASKIFHFPLLIIFKQIVQLWTCQYKNILILLWVFVTYNIVNSEHDMSTAKSLCYMAPPALGFQNVSHEKWWKMSVRPTLITTLQTTIFDRFCPY